MACFVQPISTGLQRPIRRDSSHEEEKHGDTITSDRENVVAGISRISSGNRIAPVKPVDGTLGSPQLLTAYDPKFVPTTAAATEKKNQGDAISTVFDFN